MDRKKKRFIRKIGLKSAKGEYYDSWACPINNGSHELLSVWVEILGTVGRPETVVGTRQESW